MSRRTGCETLRAMNCMVVPQDEKAPSICKFCSEGIWWNRVQTKNGIRNIPMSEAGHGGGGDMVLQRHHCKTRGTT